MNPLLEYQVVREQRHDLERKLEHLRLIMEFENKNKTRSGQSKLILSISGIIIMGMVVAQLLG